ncbi:MAG TPA: DUF488 domain-containing protein [Candidatus Bathyarchaeia archaeon]
MLRFGSKMSQELYTIGHSTHPLSQFLDLLVKHGISAICDVRSNPYSRLYPQFNRESLQKELALHNIAYVFLGEELGARSSDSSCYEGGKVQYNRLAATDAFRRGIERVKKGIQRYRVALMCAEKDPLTCHRTILVCRHLKAPDVSIRHILDNGRIEPHEASERRLIKLVGVEQGDLFQDFRELLERAYDLQGQRIAYTKPPTGMSRESHENHENGE